jgi:hypothetical protein
VQLKTCWKLLELDRQSDLNHYVGPGKEMKLVNLRKHVNVDLEAPVCMDLHVV